jgi:hypothetical protein
MTRLVCFFPLGLDNFCSTDLYTEPVVLVGALEGSFLASFGLGWGVTIGAGLASYPLDTIRLVAFSVSLTPSHLFYIQSPYDDDIRLRC